MRPANLPIAEICVDVLAICDSVAAELTPTFRIEEAMLSKFWPVVPMIVWKRAIVSPDLSSERSVVAESLATVSVKSVMDSLATPNWPPSAAMFDRSLKFVVVTEAAICSSLPRSSSADLPAMSLVRFTCAKADS